MVRIRVLGQPRDSGLLIELNYKMAKTITRKDLQFIIKVADFGLEGEEEDKRYEELKSIIEGNENLTLI